ncbi:TlpA disulfide reductase family protein [Methylophaga thiooxydans]|uniref:Antioxidant, AhpC/TSA family n=1 Tax=Methylophaga thiooxydans DMS010 TaxID=637616 RepID=C0N2A9_9GAMM|nr:TlpA disulfide reductase family protein [Methylophaga thiooxydans]EEF81148.1 antioxidant, AhpC/TSA family [Methylophaga thiooxydans DMS010]
MMKLILSTLLLSTSVFAANDMIMTAVTPNEQAKNFTLESPSGATISLSDYSGKYVLVNFWAHWCSPCIKEFPDMQKLYDESDKTQFEIIAIHAGPYNSEAAQFVKHFGISFPIVSDPDTSLKGWDIPVLPMSYLVDPEGNVVYKAMGPREWNVEDIQPLISN